MEINRILTLTIVCIFVITFGNGTNVQFFRSRSEANSTGKTEFLSYESSSTAACNKIPPGRFGISHIVSDSCHMVYNDDNCKSFCRRKVVSGESRSEQSLYLVEYGSFHYCNDEVGGNKLNLDITETGPSASVKHRYRDVCSCVNIPPEMENSETWTLDNYGNDFVVYFDPNCSEQRVTGEVISTKPGPCDRNELDNESWFVKNEGQNYFKVKIQSFGPTTDSEYFKASCNPHQMAVKQLAEIAKMNKLLAKIQDQLDKSML